MIREVPFLDQKLDRWRVDIDLESRSALVLHGLLVQIFSSAQESIAIHIRDEGIWSSCDNKWWETTLRGLGLNPELQHQPEFAVEFTGDDLAQAHVLAAVAVAHGRLTTLVLDGTTDAYCDHDGWLYARPGTQTEVHVVELNQRAASGQLSQRA